ncbi:hypothetical protein QYE76_019781 [Lolium multiflorum]|uniref:Transposase (putative) gypsy type domain-containing protein n=1 Tax=Lolium multiflorum TaxID=4521 RepID=A0AAD8R754_LOLMU|nr:hypothetical protein QYE76_019781 [Lolium multiflorum]
MAAEDLDWERSKISNQDLNLMKKLGLMKKDDAIRFPSEESYPNPPMEYRLTPNSILHISIFITLCECFLGVPPNWALWKRIFLLRRNASRNATYNIGGVVICVRTDVEYFDVKFPDSVQGWRKKWLYIHEESANSVEHNIVPFDGNAKIQRRRSWDAEASEEEKKATEALMSRIRQLQNTRGEELSGVQITAYFLRIRVQPLQARKNPLWTYTGVNDANRLSSDLSAKDLEKLIRRISRLNKKDPVPSSCRVVPYSSTNPLPENHPTMSSLPPLPEDGEVEEQAIVAEDNQGSSLHESEVAGSHKSAASHEKEIESEASESTQSLPPAVSPKNKRKRDDAEASGTSKPEETDPSSQKAAYDPYLGTLISSDEEEEVPTADVAARTSTSHTLVASETPVEGEETSPPRQNVDTATPPSPRAPLSKRARTEIIPEPTLQLSSSSNPLLEDPLIKDLLRIGTQFVGYREYASKAEEKLAEANERANTLAQQLEQSEKARKEAESDAVGARAEADKAKADAAGVEDLRKRLHDAETSLSDHITAQSAREEAILKRLKTQSRRFVARTAQEFQLEEPVNDPLLDALSFLEVHGSEAREGIDQAKAGLSRLFPYFFPKKEEPATFLDLAKSFNSAEDLGLKMRQENMKVAVESTVALVADSRQTIDWMKVGDTSPTSNVDPNNVPLASLVAQEENVDVNFIKNNNFNNNAYRNNSGNNYRPYPSANGNGYGNSYGNSYNNNRNVPSGLEAMLKEFISTQTAFNKSVEEKLDKIDTIASRVDRLASDVNLLKLKVMPNNDLDNKITTTANAIQLIFDNYSPIPDPPEVFPSSLAKKSSVPVNLDDSSSVDLTEELKELRVQLQSVKKQSLILMEQSRESSEKEKIALQQAQDAITDKDAAVAEADAAASRENSMLQLLTDASLDMAGAFLDPITEDERVEARSNVLLRLAHEHGSTFWGTPERTRQIVRFQDRALQMPETLPALMDKFRDAPRIHGFVRAQLAAGARFAMIMIKICYPKLDVGQVVPKCLEKMSKRKRNFGKYDDIVTPVAEDMMDELLRMDSEFFVKGSYAEHSTRAVNNEHLTIDNILGNS